MNSPLMLEPEIAGVAIVLLDWVTSFKRVVELDEFPFVGRVV